MPFVTTLTLESGDRDGLDALTAEIRRFAERKGAEFRGPHTSPPERLHVPLYNRLADPVHRFGTWPYTVFQRRIEIVGHDEVARAMADWDFPTDVHVQVDVSQVRSAGARKSE